MGFSPDAVTSMLFSIMAGRGGMAQFNHPEFGGSGQWVTGGAIAISDMFNNVLKARVGALQRIVGAGPRPMPHGVFYWGDWGAPDPVLGGLARADTRVNVTLSEGRQRLIRTCPTEAPDES